METTQAVINPATPHGIISKTWHFCRLREIKKSF